jgi:aarF domain-containing kinase
MSDSFFKRTYELTKLSLKVGFSELKSGDLKSRIDQAKMITETLSQLKGAAMKAGQMLSIELDEYFPPEAMKFISQLQNQATSSDFKTIESILKKELGIEDYKKIENISHHPIASASIAQIHTGFVKNQKVAIKIQHPGVAKSINSDVALIKKVAQGFCKMTNRKMNLTPLFNEMKEVLIQEVNFEQEVDFMKKYRKKIEQSGPSAHDHYIVPVPVSGLCTKKVIVMSWEEGININEWIQSEPSRAKKQQLAHLVLNLYIKEFYHWGLVQTDPNFANFLVQEDKNNMKLVVLDFGATRTYDKPFREQYLTLIGLVKDKSYPQAIQQAIDFGLLDARDAQETQQLFIELMDLAVEPFFTSQKNKKFNFADREYNEKTKECVKKFVMSLKYSPPPYKLLFLHRKLGGISALLRRLQVEMDLTKYWDLMFDDK